jgi:hypothetical protein
MKHINRTILTSVAFSCVVGVHAQAVAPPPNTPQTWNAFIVADGRSLPDGRIEFCKTLGDTLSYIQGAKCLPTGRPGHGAVPPISSSLDEYLAARLGAKLDGTKKAVAVGVAPIIYGVGRPETNQRVAASNFQFVIYYRF